MTIKNIFTLIVIASSLAACKQANSKYDKPYFDFDSLVTVQIRKASAKDSIHKEAMLDGNIDLASFPLDSTRLAHEWDVFRQLDIINKPLYKSSYKITEEKDTKSNLMVRVYKWNGNPKSNPPVPFVRFYFHAQFKDLKKIESSYREENALYFTERNLILSFSDLSGEPLINEYGIEGSQKMILSENVKFSIRGKIGVAQPKSMSVEEE
jgi:hypothetical protein